MIDLDKEYGRPCRKIYTPIGPYEMRIIVRQDDTPKYYAISIDTNSKYCQKIETILQQMFCAKGGKMTQLKKVKHD